MDPVLELKGGQSLHDSHGRLAARTGMDGSERSAHRDIDRKSIEQAAAEWQEFTTAVREKAEIADARKASGQYVL